MPKIKQEDVLRFNRYLRSLIEESVRTQGDGITSDEISTFIENRLKTDVKNRVNALLAIGSEVGVVNQNEEGRYVVKSGVADLDKALDRCYRPRSVSPSATPCRQSCPPKVRCTRTKCCSPRCCKRIKRYAHRKQRRLPGYREEICENYYSGSEA